MAKKPNITPMAPGKYDPARLNANLERIQDAFDNTVSRDGSTPNQMNADLDLDSNDILNVNSVNAKIIEVNGKDISAAIFDAAPYAAAAEDAADRAEAAATLSNTQAAIAATNAGASAAAGSAVEAANHRDEAEDFAIAAGVSASQSSASAVAAAISRNEAASYAASAGESADFYDTIALGRAAVANGATFGVIAGGADGLLRPTLYRRNSASTQTEIVEMVSFPEFRTASIFEAGGVGGTENDITATCPITPALGDTIWITPVATSTGTVTLSINGGAAFGVRDLSKTLLAPGQFRAGVRYLLWRYSSSAYAVVAPTVSRYVRAQAGGSLNDMVSDGTYIATGAFTDGPIDFTASAALVDVVTFGQNFVMQTMRETGNGGGFWHRVIRPGVSIYNAWTNIGTGGGSGGGGSTFTGKRAVFLGDSITENHTWPLEAATALGLGTPVKGGFGGTRLSEMSSGSLSGMCGVDVADAIASGDWTDMEAAAEARFLDNGDDNRPIVAALKAVNWSQINFIVGFWGTNDFNNSVPLGTTGVSDRTTIRGSVNYFMERVCGTYPHIQVLWVAPMFRARQAVGDGKDSDNFPNSAGTYLVEYGDAIRSEAGDKWHMPGLDLYRESGINLYNYAAYLSDQTIDGLHPREFLGNERVKNMIVAGFRRYL